MKEKWQDEILVAFADGELDPEVAQRVSADLEHDPEARRKVEVFRTTGRMMKTTFDDGYKPSLTSPVSLPQTRFVQPWPMDLRRSGLAMAVAASIALLAVGGIGGYYSAAGQGAHGYELAWVEEMATYYNVYAADDAHLVEIYADKQDEIEAWFSERLGRGLQVPNLAEIGFRFRGARLVAVEDDAAMMMIYDSPGARPIAFCIMPGIEMKDHAPTKGHSGGLDVIHWARDGIGFILAGAVGENALRALVSHVEGALAKG